MKCFYYFKDRTRSREQRSAPIFKEQSKTDISATDRVTKSSSSATSHRSILELYEEKAQNLRVFSFSELRQATNGFSRLLKIGEGGFGSVYKGSIKPADGVGDPIVVAIKMLNRDGFQVLIFLSMILQNDVNGDITMDVVGWCMKYSFHWVVF